MPEYAQFVYGVMEIMDFDTGEVVEVKRPKEKARTGRQIVDCRFCGYTGRSELGLLPLPASGRAEFCPSCRGGVVNG
jgi:hypothetical protein